MAGLGTAAFSVLYRVPKKYFLDLGTLGAGSWLLYLLIWNNTHHEVLAILFPALLYQSLSPHAFWPTTVDVQLQSS
ncbi:MAG: threonine/serine exporter family protein [Streptococcus salivarius]